MVGILADKLNPLVGLSLIALLLAACEEQNTYVEPPPPKVTISQPLVQEVTDYLEFTGTAAASAQVEVPARVPGVLREMLFQPGTRVAEGDLLFVIDPVIYEADLQVAKAELASAEAQKSKSSKALKRADTLIKSARPEYARPGRDRTPQARYPLAGAALGWVSAPWIESSTRRVRRLAPTRPWWRSGFR